MIKYIGFAILSLLMIYVGAVFVVWDFNLSGMKGDDRAGLVVVWFVVNVFFVGFDRISL